jgi:tripartite-type tricarboxylate transporter receptor subunit TctC
MGAASMPAAADVSDTCKAMLSGERMTIAVPNNAGGGYDTYARALAPAIEKHGGLSVRVANMPAGGGLAARSFALNAQPDDLTILIENVGDLVTTKMGDLGRDQQSGKAFVIDGFDTVGVLHIDVAAWLARTGLDITNPDVDQLIASEGGLEEALLPVVIAGMALGIETGVVSGYDGSSEMSAAILRGEADFSTMSSTTAFRRAQDEGLEVVLMLSDGPAVQAPELPYIAGEGSVVWALTEGLPTQEAKARRDMATAVAALRSSGRGLFITTNASAERRSCVAEIMDVASADAEFVAAAEAQGRPVEALTADDARAFVAKLQVSNASVLPLMEEVSARILGGN